MGAEEPPELALIWDGFRCCGRLGAEDLPLQPSGEEQSPKGSGSGVFPLHLPLAQDPSTFLAFVKQSDASSRSFTLSNRDGLGQKGGCAASLTASAPEVPYLS